VFVQKEPNPGGFGLGRLGPVPEGIVAWAFGLGLVILAAVFIERGSR
jgi:ubiquinol-cytochrome c reductase cytochrome c subunit